MSTKIICSLIGAVYICSLESHNFTTLGATKATWGKPETAGN